MVTENITEDILYKEALQKGFLGSLQEFLDTLQGPSAYDLALEQGFKGSLQDWLKTLKAKSLYELALETGFKGTLREWLETLKPKSLYKEAVQNGFKGDFIAFTESLKGASAYQLAVQSGFFTGTLTEWLYYLQGKSAYQIALEQGFQGSENAWLASLKGKSSYALAVDAGFKGTIDEYLLSLRGSSAYSLALSEGFVGSLSDWVLSLKGSQGDSAYDIAVQEGYTGTKKEWVSSLKEFSVSLEQNNVLKGIVQNLFENTLSNAVKAEELLAEVEIILDFNKGLKEECEQLLESFKVESTLAKNEATLFVNKLQNYLSSLQFLEEFVKNFQQITYTTADILHKEGVSQEVLNKEVENTLTSLKDLYTNTVNLETFKVFSQNFTQQLNAFNNSYIKNIAKLEEEYKQKYENITIKTGNGVHNFSTENNLLLFKPDASDSKFAYAFDTQHSFEWDGTKWNDLGPSQLELAKKEIQNNNEKIDETYLSKYFSDNDELLIAITDAEGNLTWVQVDKETGLPTQATIDLLREINNLEVVDGEIISETGEKIAIALRDKDGNLTALTVREEDGMFPDAVIENIKERLNIKIPDVPSVTDVPDTFRVYDNNTSITFLSSISQGLLRHINNTPLPSSPYYFVDSLGQGARIWLPTNYDDSKPIPLLMVCDGVSTGATGGSGAPSVRSQWLPLLEEGIAICKSQAHGNSYGNAACMQSNYEVFKKACEIAPIGAVVITGNSMGAIAAQNLLLTNTIPNVSGLYLTDPTYSLRQRYDNGRYDEITAAYKLSADGSDYTEKTKGHDPALRHWSHYRGLPVSIRGSSGDSTVPLVEHGTKLKTYLSEHNDVTYVNVGSSGHSIADRFITEDILNFIKKCTKFK